MANRLSIANWSFAIKFAVPCLMIFALLVFVGMMGLSTIDRLKGNLQDVAQTKFYASSLIDNTVQNLSEANGALLQMQINQAAGVKQDVDKESKAINGQLDEVLSSLQEYKDKYASAADIPKIDAAIANIKTYKDAVAFVSSMLDVDFKATVNFLVPLAKARDETLLSLKDISGAFLTDSKKQTTETVEAITRQKSMLFAVSGGALLIVALATLFIITTTIRSVRNVADATRRVAAGDIDIDIEALSRNDELGDVVHALGVFCENIAKVNSMKAEQAEMERKTAQQRKQALESLAKGFKSSVGRIVSMVAASATELQSNARNLASTADQTSQLSMTVAAATEEASSSVQTVASAAEELSASIGEIAHQVNESTQVSMGAVEEVKRTDVTVSSLSDAAAQIGDVVKLIQSIAGQTNLLALNATIEAARAGEAGKGFAVVASEVKNLATQTARATEEISGKIQTVQNVAAEAVVAIRGIGKTIEQISEVTGVISNAVQQQNAATREISSNVQKAFEGTSRVSGDITNVTQAAAESRHAADEVLQASSQLSKQSMQLDEEVQTFLVGLRDG